MQHRQTTSNQESNAVKQTWGFYNLDFDGKKGDLRVNNRPSWHINYLKQVVRPVRPHSAIVLVFAFHTRE